MLKLKTHAHCGLEDSLYLDVCTSARYLLWYERSARLQ
jgi:hypothetical protein